MGGLCVTSSLAYSWVWESLFLLNWANRIVALWLIGSLADWRLLTNSLQYKNSVPVGVYEVCLSLCYYAKCAKLHYTDTGYGHHQRTALQQFYNKFATSQCQSPTSRHVKMLGCGKFLVVLYNTSVARLVRVVEFGTKGLCAFYAEKFLFLFTSNCVWRRLRSLLGVPNVTGHSPVVNVV